LQGEANANKISEILAFAQKWPGPLMLLGDWNATPEEMEASGVLKAFGPKRCMTIRLAGDQATCTAGKGQRILDYALVDLHAAALLGDMREAADTPWKTHKGISASILGSPRQVLETCRLNVFTPDVAPSTWTEAKQNATTRKQTKDQERMMQDITQAPLLDSLMNWEAGAVLANDLQVWGSTLDEWMASYHGVKPCERYRCNGTFSPPCFCHRAAYTQSQAA